MTVLAVVIFLGIAVPLVRHFQGDAQQILPDSVAVDSAKINPPAIQIDRLPLLPGDNSALFRITDDSVGVVCYLAYHQGVALDCLPIGDVFGAR